MTGVQQVHKHKVVDSDLVHANQGHNPSRAGVETTAQLWTEDRRALEVTIHAEKTRDHENWEPDLLSQVARFSACSRCVGCLPVHCREVQDISAFLHGVLFLNSFALSG